MTTLPVIFRRFGIAALSLVVAGLVIRSSFDPSQYFRYGDGIDRPFVYPAGSVALVVAVTLLEGVLLSGILRPWRPGWSWRRPLIALFLFLPWLGVNGLFVMHGPGYLMIHHLWLFALVVSLVVVLLVSVLLRAILGERSRRGSPLPRAAG